MADQQPQESAETTMSKVSETRRMYLAYLIWLSYMAFISFVSLHPVQLPGDTLGIIIGNLGTIVGIVIGYYFTTSMGSSVKSQIMGAMGKPASAVTVPTGTTSTVETKVTPQEKQP